MKDVESQESHQQETFDGVGIVPENMIGIPAGDQFVKAIIFDVPALVSETYDLVREQLSGGSGGHP